MLSRCFLDIFSTDPWGFYGLSEGVTFRGEAAREPIRRTIDALSQQATRPPKSSGPATEYRFAFLVSRFDFDDIRYGHVPRMALYASILLDCFPGAKVAFVVTGAPARAHRPWDAKNNLHLAENWITASATRTPLYPFQSFFRGEKADLIRFFTPRDPGGADSLPKAYSLAFQWLFAFGPTHVFCPGGVYYPTPAADLLFDFFPIIRFPFKPTNRFSPNCDAVLENTPLKHPPLGADRRVPVNLVGAIEMVSEYGVGDLQDLPRNAVVGLTAIAGTRLTASLAEAPDAWLDGMAAAFAHHPRFHWLLVGEQSRSARPQIDARLAPFVSQGRIRILPYADGLEQFYHRSDFMLQPYGQTGGGSALLIGMQRRLPVVSFGDHDLSGNIPNGCGQATIKDGLEALDQYLRDPVARWQAGAIAHAEYDVLAKTAGTEAGKFRTLIHIASQSFRDRMPVCAK